MPDISEVAFARVKEVFEQWAMYDAVVQHDYMRHTELAAALADWATEFAQPLEIVDLGCGDAGLATNGFRAAHVKHYLGVDLSESSVERARGHLSIWSGRAEIICGNLAETLAGLTGESVNTVLASYSLHHFSTSDKIKLVSEVWRLLKPGGAFLWIDAVRDNGESRDDYISRLTHTMEKDWVGLTVEQRRRGVEHVRTSDYPETSAWMRDEVAAAGFNRSATLLKDEFFDGWVFTKP